MSQEEAPQKDSASEDQISTNVDKTFELVSKSADEAICASNTEAPAPEAPAPEAPAPETPAPEAPAPEAPEAPTPETPAPEAPAPEAPAPEAPAPEAPAPEAPEAPETIGGEARAEVIEGADSLENDIKEGEDKAEEGVEDLEEGAEDLGEDAKNKVTATIEEGEGEVGDVFSKLKAYGEDFYEKVKSAVVNNHFFNSTTAGIWLKKEFISLEDLIGFHKESSAEGATTAEHQGLLDAIADKIPAPTEEGSGSEDIEEEEAK